MILDNCRGDFIVAQQECVDALEKLDTFVRKNYMDVSHEDCCDKNVTDARELRNKLEALIQTYVKS